jgi:hypothetical protein
MKGPTQKSQPADIAAGHKTRKLQAQRDVREREIKKNKIQTPQIIVLPLVVPQL